MSVQYTIPFKIQPDFSLAALVVHEGISAAQAALSEPQKWPAQILVLSGAAASGKSHLAANIGRAIFKWDLTERPISNRAEAEVLFHTINEVQAREEKLLILSRVHPNQIYPALLDLDSRLKTAIHVPIVEPKTEDARIAILFKMCADHQLKIDLDTARYIVRRLPQTLAASRMLCELATLNHQKSTLSKVASKPIIEHVQKALGEGSNIFCA